MTTVLKAILTCDGCERMRLAVTSAMVAGPVNPINARLYAAQEGWSTKVIEGSRIDLCPGCTGEYERGPELYIEEWNRHQKKERQHA